MSIPYRRLAPRPGLSAPVVRSIPDGPLTGEWFRQFITNHLNPYALQGTQGQTTTQSTTPQTPPFTTKVNSPLNATTMLTNVVTEPSTVGMWAPAQQVHLPDAVAFDVDANGGIVDLLFGTSGTWGNGYIIRFDGRNGLIAGQILKFTAGSWNNIGTAVAAPNTAALGGTYRVVAVMGLNGAMAVYVDGELQVKAVDTTYTLDGSTYLAIEVATSAKLWVPSAIDGILDYVADGTEYVHLAADHAVSNVAYNFRGAWTTGNSYVQGDEVVYGQTYWLAINPSTGSPPSTSNANWQAVASYNAFQGAWSAATSYVVGDEATYSGNYWVCVTANTNSAPSTTNANWQIAGPTSAADISYTDGSTVESLQPAEAGADVTGTHTSNDTSNVNGVASSSISPIANLMPAEAGADVTGTHTSNDTSNVNGVAAATVSQGASRANAAIDSTNVVVSSGVDFSRPYTNKGALATANNADGVPAGATYGIPPVGILNNDGNIPSNVSTQGNVVFNGDMSIYTPPTGVQSTFASSVRANDNSYGTPNGWTRNFGNGGSESGCFLGRYPQGTGSWTSPAPWFLIAQAAANQEFFTVCDAFPVRAGVLYNFSAAVNPGVGSGFPSGASWYFRVQWYSGAAATTAGGFASGSAQALSYDDIVEAYRVGGPQTPSGQIVAPAGAAYCRIAFGAWGAPAAAWNLGVTNVICQTTQDDGADGTTYYRMPAANMDGNRRGLIDFSQPGHLNKTMDYMGEGSDYLRMPAPPGVSSSGGATLTQSGTGTTIDVAAGTMYIGNLTMNFNAGSVNPGSYGTYYVYFDSPNYAGGAVTFYATTNPAVLAQSPWRFALGSITTASGGGGTGGGSGGSPCFSGDTRIRTPAALRRFDELPPDAEFEVLTLNGPKRAVLLVHDTEATPCRKMGEHIVTENHLMRFGEGWVPASMLFHERAETKPRRWYNMHVLSADPLDHHYILENGLVAHNLKA